MEATKASHDNSGGSASREQRQIRLLFFTVCSRRENDEADLAKRRRDPTGRGFSMFLPTSRTGEIRRTLDARKKGPRSVEQVSMWRRASFQVAEQVSLFLIRWHPHRQPDFFLLLSADGMKKNSTGEEKRSDSILFPS
ncbi:hypothetical protein KSP40_PGU016958 [Platanthera guangdongensis]|uniref:Uncharacterized protein n=1 Tax=Platanthera guangdongensis TaxID=2320717 RepID=A0ABR2MZ27_9ASPA